VPRIVTARIDAGAILDEAQGAHAPPGEGTRARFLRGVVTARHRRSLRRGFNFRENLFDGLPARSGCFAPAEAGEFLSADFLDEEVPQRGIFRRGIQLWGMRKGALPHGRDSYAGSVERTRNSTRPARNAGGFARESGKENFWMKRRKADFQRENLKKSL